MLLAAVLASPPPASVCAHDPVPAHVVGADAPDRMRPDLIRPYATVVAAVDANGHVTEAHVDDTTGNLRWDAAAVAAMRRWTFAPAARNCVSVAGTAEFAVGFGGKYDFADPLNHIMVMVSAQPPDYPSEGRTVARATVLVKVSLDPIGRVMALSVYQSSGNEYLDRAALAAARNSVYLPDVRAGFPKASTYLFRSQFDANN